MLDSNNPFCVTIISSNKRSFFLKGGTLAREEALIKKVYSHPGRAYSAGGSYSLICIASSWLVVRLANLSLSYLLFLYRTWCTYISFLVFCQCCVVIFTSVFLITLCIILILFNIILYIIYYYYIYNICSYYQSTMAQ